MSALYIMRYMSGAGATTGGPAAAARLTGAGAIYIGRNTILGVDVAGNRYEGTYVEEDGRLKAAATLTVGPSGSDLVTGDKLPAGQKVPLNADWPIDFEGRLRDIEVKGKSVEVLFEKLGNIP